MKKYNKVLVFALVIVAVFSMNFIVNATNKSIKAVENENLEISAYAADLNAYINDALNSNIKFRTATDEILLDKIVSDFIISHGKNYNAELLKNSTKQKIITIDDENRIIINGLTVAVCGNKTVKATPDRIMKGAIKNHNLSSFQSSGTTPIKEYYYVCYGAILGQELWRIAQEAQFTYTGHSVTVNYSNGYYKHGFLSIWQVSNWEESTQSSILVDNVWTKKVASSGNFHYGIEYQGVGLVIEDHYVTIDARCTVDGVTSGYYTIR